MEEALLETIREIINQKSEASQAPLLVTRMEIEQEVSRALNALFKRKAILVGRTANDKWIKLKE